MINEPCFFCGAAASRRVPVEVGSATIRGGAVGTRHVSQSAHQPLCEKCITERAEVAVQTLKVAGGLFAAMSGVMVFITLAPVVLCVLSAIGVALWGLLRAH